MNYCSNCGNKVNPNDNFCTKCGTSLKAFENTIEEKKKPIKAGKFYYFEEEYNEYINGCRFNIEEAKDFFNSNVCGSCGCVLDKELKANLNCPNCKKKIYVRTDIISKEKLELTDDTMSEFQKYDKKVRELLFFEKLMKRNEYVHNNYKELFSSLKEKMPLRPRDVMWRFGNEVFADLDIMGSKLFMQALKLPPQDRVLQGFDAIKCFSSSVQEMVLMYEVAEYKKQIDVAFDLLTNIVYRDVHLTVLDKEIDEFHKFTIDDYTSHVHSALVTKFLKKYDLSLEDFKKRFLESRHPFVLERLSNQECWKYVEIALKNQISYENS